MRKWVSYFCFGSSFNPNGKQILQNICEKTFSAQGTKVVKEWSNKATTPRFYRQVPDDNQVSSDEEDHDESVRAEKNDGGGKGPKFVGSPVCAVSGENQ